MNKYLPLANDQKIIQHNHSGLDQFDKFISLAHFFVSKKRTTAHLRTPIHCFQLTSRALTVPLLLPSRLHGDRSPYYSFVQGTHMPLSGSLVTMYLAQLHFGNGYMEIGLLISNLYGIYGDWSPYSTVILRLVN